MFEGIEAILQEAVSAGDLAQVWDAEEKILLLLQEKGQLYTLIGRFLSQGIRDEMIFWIQEKLENEQEECEPYSPQVSHAGLLEGN
jgi:hypothetical protein